MLLSLLIVTALSLACGLPAVRLCFVPLPVDFTAAPQVVLDVPDMPTTWEGFI